MIKLVCPECQRQNEPERIYCHDCGARLDRSALAKVAPKVEDPKATQKRLKQMLDPGRIKLRLMFFKISKLILGAGAVAALIQMLLPPDVPEKSKNIELQQINLDLENAITTHSAAPLQYSETQVNNYMVNVVKNKHAVLSKYLEFERALVNLDEGVIRITAERSFMGFSVFHSISYNVSVKDGTLTTKANGGSIGRLPIHPMIMQYGDILFVDLFAALEREKKSVSKLTPIQFHPKMVILNAKTPIDVPSAPAAPSEPQPAPAPSEAQPPATPTPGA
jgi:hypothetical protein